MSSSIITLYNLILCQYLHHLAQSADGSTEWHYEEGYSGYGPTEWFQIPGAQNCGHSQQSPIEINPLLFENSTNCSTPLYWFIDDTTYNFTVSHKGEGGHTILFQSSSASDNIFLNNSFQYEGNSQHEQYKLDSFHLHWGPGNQNGSEHIFTGLITTLEIHFVHFSIDYESVGQAVAAWENASESDDPLTNDMHTLGVVGVLFEEVADNETYNVEADAIVRLMATDPGMDDLWRNATGETYLAFKITDLMDVDDFMENYYHYEGSLTTPPCTPAVRWHLARNTVKIRNSTMNLFRSETKLWQNGGIDADRNFRPIQTNPSCIWTCNEEYCPEETEVDFGTFHYEDSLQGGPSTWYLLDNGALCDHEQQSPILIDPANFNLDRECSEELEWNVDDTSYQWTISHKGEGGHTLSIYNENSQNNVYLTNLFQYEDNYQHPRYNLDSFHVHWGPGPQNGSEHRFENITTTFEVHFVHYSNDYGGVGEALEAWWGLSNSTDPEANDMHTLAVTGFLFEEVGDDDDYNVKADAVLYKMANDSGMDDLWNNATGYAYLEFAITDLVDIDDFKSNYYFYEGSLTTPPCTPAVRWHLAANTIKVRRSTMDLFRAETRLWSDATGAIDADSNFRPIQSNPSCIYSCGDRWCPDEEGIDFPEWHYEDDLWDGPSNWYKINPLCGHDQQSPILIDPSDFDDIDTCSQPLEWNVDDTIYNWSITHKGESGHTLTVYNEYAKDDVYLKNSFQYDGNEQHEKYKLYAFHFHWGPGNQNGSEHIYEGVTTTFEVHFVHFSDDYVSVNEALDAWEDLSESTDSSANDMHTLGVVGFLFEEVGEDDDYNVKADAVLREFGEDPEMDALWQNATGEAHLSFAITDLVDADDFMGHYYHYEGSLTTPPCTPAVRWHLAQNTIKVRKSTMDIFRNETQKWKTATGAVDADMNFRPIQSNPNCVYTCSSDAWCPGIDYPEWHYEDSLEDGPSNWYLIEGGELCAHEQQSPIEIDPSKFVVNLASGETSDCSPILDWHVDDTVYNWTVTHKGEGGHTLSIDNSDAKNDIYLTNSFQYDGNSQHSKYKFYGFHFHWGPGNQNGSEHVYKDVTTTFEVHFVHVSEDYQSILAALDAWDELSNSTDPAANDMHTLAVTGFLFEEVGEDDDYNEKADEILRLFAVDEQMDELWHNATGAAYLAFSITDFVDVEDFQNNYYHYEGSLTTPPCTPAVRWHLAKNTIKVRSSTMDLFRNETAIWETSTGYVDATSNFRPVQLNPSCIWTCDTEFCPEDQEIDYGDWHYEDNLEDGPSNWYKINPLCGHEQQSPILIDPTDFNDILSENDCNSPLEWNVDDTVYNWTVTHKGEGGHTLDVSNDDAKDDVYLKNSYQTTSQHSKYKLSSFHFHWGPGNVNGSEHVFDGVTTTFEVHYVHYSDDYLSVGAAVEDWEDLHNVSGKDMHTLGVAGFLFEEVGDDEDYNEKSDEILGLFANDAGMDELWNNGSGQAFLSFAITDFVPVEDFQNNYYHYWGSLTTPPCTPAVSWHLARNTIKVRKSTMDAFRNKTKQWKTATGAVDADRNFRPIQSNPSCISTCHAFGEDLEYCPEAVVVDDDDDDNNFLLPLWICLGILGGLLLIGIPVYLKYFRNKEGSFIKKGDEKNKLVSTTSDLRTVEMAERTDNMDQPQESIIDDNETAAITANYVD